MKKTVLILVFTVLAFNAFSQGRGEKLKALKVAFITERLNLSPEEAEKFWPIYNEFEENELKFRTDSFIERRTMDFDNISNEEANKMIEDFIASENERHLLKQKFIEDIREVLPAKKVLLLRKAEADFKREMLEQFKNRRQGRP